MNMEKCVYVSPVSVWIYIYTCMKWPQCVCPQHKKRSFTARVGQSHPVLLLAAVREPVPEWEESDERKEECSLQKRMQLEKHCSPVPPGSSPPLYLRPQLPTTARDLLLQLFSQWEQQQKLKSQLQSSMANENSSMKAERWDEWWFGGFGKWR